MASIHFISQTNPTLDNDQALRPFCAFCVCIVYFPMSENLLRLNVNPIPGKTLCSWTIGPLGSCIVRWKDHFHVQLPLIQANNRLFFSEFAVSTTNGHSVSWFCFGLCFFVRLRGCVLAGKWHQSLFPVLNRNRLETPTHTGNSCFECFLWNVHESLFVV